MIIQRRGWTATVRNVLGEERQAEVNPGPEDRFPWITCPFCGTGVYLHDPAPHEHASAQTIAHDGRCNNPCCSANPDMPVARAQAAKDAADRQRREEADRRQRYADARARQEEYDREKWAEWDRLKKEAAEKGACEKCLFSSWCSNRSKPKFIRHRAGCPRERS